MMVLKSQPFYDDEIIVDGEEHRVMDGSVLHVAPCSDMSFSDGAKNNT